jgi:hypothetical protein
MERNAAKLVLRPNLVETINGRGQRANMPLREGHEFLRGHRVGPSARMSLSPATERGFSSGLPGAAHSLEAACCLMISDPREAGFSAKVRLSHPWGQAVPGGDRLGGSSGDRLRVLFIAASRNRLTSLQQTDMVQRADHGVVGSIIRLHRDHRYLEEIEVDH